MKRLRALGARWPWLGHALDVNDRVGEVNGGSVASSVTLTVFVSLFPLALAMIAVVGFLAHGNANIPHRIISGLSLKGSAATTVRNAIVTAQRSRKTASVVGFVGLLWSGLGVTTAIGMAVRTPWQVKAPGLRSRLHGLLWLLGAVVLGGGSVALGALLRVLPSSLAVVGTIGLIVIGVVVEVGFFLWTFWIFGDRRAGWKAMLPGAIVGAVGFEVLKLGATLYLPRLIANSSSLYGPLGVVFAILAWLALFARLLVYASAVNAVRFERANGTVTLHIEAPRFDGPQLRSDADRGGAIVADTAKRLTTARAGPARARVSPQAPVLGPSPGRLLGNTTVKRAPPPGGSSITTLPSCWATMRATMASPRPAPPSSRLRASSSRVNRSNTRVRSAGGMPGPSSTTTRVTSRSSSVTAKRITDRAWRAALVAKFSTSWPSWSPSPTTWPPDTPLESISSVVVRRSAGGLAEHDLVEVHRAPAGHRRAALAGQFEQLVGHRLQPPQGREHLGPVSRRDRGARLRSTRAGPAYLRSGCAARGWRRR